MELSVFAKSDAAGGMFNVRALVFFQNSNFYGTYLKNRAGRYALRLLMFFCLTLSASGLLAEDNVVQEPSVAKEITAIIAAKQHPYLKPENFANRSDDLAALYKLSNYQLLWLGNNDNNQNITQLLALLKNAADNGLNAANYNTRTLQQMLSTALLFKPDAYRELAQYDTALSLSLLRFLHDLHYGRVNPQGINFNLKLRDKKLIDLPLLIKSNIDQHAIAQLPTLVEPKLKQYQQLKSALASYRQLADKSKYVPLFFDRTIRPGDNIKQLDELKQFLAATGDLPADTNGDNAPPSTRYSGKIVAAVKTFQQRHGLAVDGVIGRTTLAELNTSPAQRVTQIELAMERLRWLPELSGGPSIIVNIPAFQLWAFDNVNVQAPEIINMKVVVGKAMKNQTPVLMADMSYIDFMPYWNVPYSIVKKEFLPKLMHNPGFLDKENMELVSSSGVVGFSATTIAQLKQGTVRVRQRPGKKNALGKVKFLFPNKEDVYLHDTPANALFSRSRRDFSHGCVRVEDPLKLAEFVLKNQRGWDKERIKKAMEATKMQRVILKQTIPVLFFYVTAFFDQQNQLVFLPDIYGQDAILLDALQSSGDLDDRELFAKPAVPPAELIKTVEVVE